MADHRTTDTFEMMVWRAMKREYYDCVAAYSSVSGDQKIFAVDNLIELAERLFALDEMDAADRVSDDIIEASLEN